MSIPTRKIICSGCSYETTDPGRPICIRYVSGDGETAETGRAKGWCYECNNYTDIESMDQQNFRYEIESDKLNQLKNANEMVRLENEFLGRYRNKRKLEQLRKNAEYFEKSIREKHILLRIAQRRKSNPRCLTCESDRTFPIVFGEDGVAPKFVHSCGGRLQLVKQNGPVLRYHFARTTLVLDEEGHFLEEE